MNDQQAEAAFRAAVASEGPAYVQAREELLRLGSDALAVLEKARTSEDRKAPLVAEMVAGWIQHKDVFDRCTGYVHGHLPGLLPPSGSFVARQRVSAVMRLGKPVVPRLLEMILKTRDWGDADGATTVFAALKELADTRAVVPLIEVAHGDREERQRRLAATTLGYLKDRRAVPELLALLRDPAQPEMLRAAAAGSLGSLGAEESAPALRAVVLDERLDPEFREAAVRAIDALRDAQSAATVVEALARAHDTTFTLLLIQALADIGGAGSVEPLHRVEQQHGVDDIAVAAREAREKVQARLESRKQ